MARNFDLFVHVANATPDRYQQTRRHNWWLVINISLIAIGTACGVAFDYLASKL